MVLFASGNWVGGGPVSYPAKYNEVIAVGATDNNDVIWNYSGWGPELDIVAPSGDADWKGNIWTTDITGSAGINNRNPSILDYTDKMGGTSAACPIAAGVAALILSIDPDLTNTEVQEILQISAADDLGFVGYSQNYGYGRINAKRAAENAATKQQWVKRYNGGIISDFGIDNLGNVIVTGYIPGSGENKNDYATIKYNPDGNELWVKYYNGPINGNDYAIALDVDSYGYIYVTGYSGGISNSFDYTTIKYAPDGNEIWIVRYDGPDSDSDIVSALAVDKSGNVYVTGSSKSDNYSYDYATVKYDSNGNKLWATRYSPLSYENDKPIAVAVDDLGNVYVTGESWGGFDAKEDFATVKYDLNGNQLWVSRYNYNETSENRDKPTAMAVDDYGNVYVTGYTYHTSTNSDCVTIKYDTNGNKLWEKLYDDPTHNSNFAYALTLDKSGNIYVTGSSYINSTRKYDYLTIKYDPNGTILWVRHYNSLQNYKDSAVSLTVDDSENVYVTGGSLSSYGGDIITIKYDIDGNWIWFKQYSRTEDSSDSAKGLVLDDYGNVYVIGESMGYTTIKYTQQNYCTQAIAYDLNGDCKVTFEDFAILANGWLLENSWSDLVGLCDSWLDCYLAYKGGCW